MADKHTLEELNNCSRDELIMIVLMMLLKILQLKMYFQRNVLLRKKDSVNWI